MLYRYKARSSDGRIVYGSQQAQSNAQVLQWLRERSLYPIEVEETKERAAKSLKERLETVSTIKLKDKAVFFRQLATMLEAGIILGSALDMLAEQTENKRFAGAIREVKTMVDRGTSLSAAMATKKRVFKAHGGHNQGRRRRRCLGVEPGPSCHLPRAAGRTEEKDRVSFDLPRRGHELCPARCVSFW